MSTYRQNINRHTLNYSQDVVFNCNHSNNTLCLQTKQTKIMNAKRKLQSAILCLILCITSISLSYSQLFIPTLPSSTILSTSYDMRAGGSGNPIGINTEADNATTGWTTIIIPSQTSNVWSSIQTLPFDFNFFGTAVTKFSVSCNGLISFGDAAPGTAVSGDNSNLPSTAISAVSAKTIACYWDAFASTGITSSTSTVSYKVFGSVGHRQLWIKYSGFMLGSPASDKNIFSCVLEETTNKIFIVDQAIGLTPLTATNGLQTGSSGVQYLSSSQKLESKTINYCDNLYS